MVKYTVIIPAYNAERTLARCLDSLLSQGRSDISILIINDGSRDGTEAIAREYCQKSPLIAYHSQPNAGVSAARNQGLALAGSAYVSFVDSDDYVMPGYFDTLDRIGTGDLLVFDRCHVGGSLRDDSGVFRRLSTITDPGALLELLMDSKKIMQPVNKCFRRELIEAHALRFDESLHIAEDFAFCMAYALRCGSIAVSRDKAYCVDVSNDASLSRSHRRDLAQQLSRAAELVRASIAAAAPANQDALLARLDELHTRNMLMSLAELFKDRSLPGRSTVRSTCAPFREPLSPRRLGARHTLLRLMLRLRLYGCLTVLAWAVRGRSYRRAAREVRHG